MLSPKCILKPSISLHLRCCHVYLNHYKLLPRHSMSSCAWLHSSPKLIYYPGSSLSIVCNAPLSFEIRAIVLLSPVPPGPVFLHFLPLSLAYNIQPLCPPFSFSEYSSYFLSSGSKYILFPLFEIADIQPAYSHTLALVMKAGKYLATPLGSDSTPCPYPLPHSSILPLSWNALDLHTPKDIMPDSMRGL